MVLFNYSTRELTAKVVDYGPGLCGKTTNLQFIHGNLPDNVKGKMLSLSTKTDRTLFFDFLPLGLGKIKGCDVKVQLFTVPGQPKYSSTRKISGASLIKKSSNTLRRSSLICSTVFSVWAANKALKSASIIKAGS